MSNRRIDAALRSATEQLHNCVQGERTVTLFKVACFLGKFRQFPDFRTEQVAGQLLSAATAIGLGDKEARKTIDRGLKYPRDLFDHRDTRGRDDEGPPVVETWGDLCRRKRLDPDATAQRWGIETGKTYGGLPAILYPVPGVARHRVRVLTVPKSSPAWMGKVGAVDVLYPEPEPGTDRPLYLVNGESAVWACVAGGLDACCTCIGDDKLLGPAALAKLVATGRRVIIPADNDAAGRKGATAKAEQLTTAGVDCRVVAVPIDKQGADMGDLYADDPDRFGERAATLPDLQPLPEPDNAPETDIDEPPEDEPQQYVRKIFKTAQVPFSLRVPKGYSLTSAGVWRVHQDKPSDLVTNAPVLITDILCDADTGQHYVELYYRTPRSAAWQTLRVERDRVMVARKAVELSALGLPLNSTQGALFAAYCSASEDALAETGHTVARTTTRMGWHGRGFLRGVHQHGDCPQYQSAGTEGATIAQQLDTAGDRRAWFDGVWPHIVRLPVLRAMVAASCAAPLLGIVECEAFALDVCGDSSIGKTTSMEVVASVWGSHRYMQSWNATRVAVERMAAICNHTPLLLDDTKAAQNPAAAGQCVYDIVTGRGRARGTITGMQATAQYQTVIISTGEGPLAETMSNAGGLRARCVTLWGSPLGEISRENAEMAVGLKFTSRHTYGHAGEALIDWLVALTPDKRAIVRERYLTEVRRLLDVCAHIESPVKSRIAEHAALIIIAGRCLEAALGMKPEIDWLTDRLFLQACARSATADRGLAAMDHALSWILTQPDAIYHEIHRRNDTPKRGQWLAKIKDERLYLNSEQLERELGGKYTMSEVRAAWRDRGWVEKARVRVSGALMTMLEIKPLALRACGAELPDLDPNNKMQDDDVF
jgi:putative DNA primase/helicase